MPTTLTGSASKSTTVDGPATGTVASSAEMRASLQTLIDNDVYLQTLTESTGVSRIRQVSSLAALSALVSISNNDVVLVTTTPPMLWRRNTAAVLTGDDPFYRAHSTEAGGWDLVRQPKAQLDYGYQTAVSAYTHTSASYGHVTGTGVLIDSVRVGDIVRISGHALCNPGGDDVNLRVRVTDSVTTHDLTTQQSRASGSTIVSVPVLAYHTVVNEGDVTVSLRAANDDNSTSISVTVQVLEVHVFRA